MRYANPIPEAKCSEKAEKMPFSYSAIRVPCAAETANSPRSERYPRIQ